MATTPGTSKWSQYARAALALFAAWYVSSYLRRPSAYLLLDHVDLAVHEAGHVIFAPLGELLSVAGGTLLQLIVPAAFFVYFVRRAQPWSATIVLFWLAQSLFNVAVYAADAEARILPLLGGQDVIHDWHYMLANAGWLEHHRIVAGLITTAGVLVYAVAVVGSFAFARLGDATPVGRREDRGTRVGWGRTLGTRA